MPIDEIINDSTNMAVGAMQGAVAEQLPETIVVNPDPNLERPTDIVVPNERLPKDINWYNSNIDIFNADKKTKLPKVTTEDEITDDNYTAVSKHIDNKIIQDYNKTNEELKLGLPLVTSVADIKLEDQQKLDKAKVISHVNKANKELEMAREVFGKSSKELQSFEPFKNLEDIRNRGEQFGKIIEKATTANTKSEQDKLFTGVTKYIGTLNKELGGKIAPPTDYISAKALITPTKDGKIPLQEQANELLKNKMDADVIKGDVLNPLPNDIPEAIANQRVKSMAEHWAEKDAQEKKIKSDIARLSRISPKGKGERFINPSDLNYLSTSEVYNSQEEADNAVMEIMANRPNLKGVGVKRTQDGMYEVQVPAQEGDAKFHLQASEISANEAIKKQNEANALMPEYNRLKAEVEKFTAQGVPIPNEIAQQYNEVSNEIQNYIDASRVMSNAAETNYAKYNELEGRRGGVLSGLALEGLKTSFGLSKAIANTMLSIAPYISKDITQGDATETINKVNDLVKKAENFYGEKLGVTPQYMEKVSGLEKATHGVLGIVPYMMAGELAFPMMVITGFASQQEALADNKDLSTDEKNLIALVKGTIGALVMQYGLKAGQSGNIINDAAFKTINQLPPKILTLKTLTGIGGKNVTQAVTDITASGLGFGALNIGAVGADKITDEIVNAVKDKEIFTPTHDIIGEAFAEAKDGLLTGALLGAVQSVVKIGADKISKFEDFTVMDKIAQDPAIRPMVNLKLRNAVIDKTITNQQYKNAMTGFKTVTDIGSQIPKDFSEKARYEIFKLLEDNQELERQKAGLAPVFVSRYDKIISENNKAIEDIANNEESEKLPPNETQDAKVTDTKGTATNRQTDLLEKKDTVNGDVIETKTNAEVSSKEVTPTISESGKPTTETAPKTPLERAKEIVNSDVIQGFSAEGLKKATNDDAKFTKYLSEIGEQASDPKSRNLTVKTYGQELVDIAEQLAKVPRETLADKIRSLKSKKGTLQSDITGGLKDLALEEIAQLIEDGTVVIEAIKKVLSDAKYAKLDKEEIRNLVLNATPLTEKDFEKSDSEKMVDRNKRLNTLLIGRGYKQNERDYIIKNGLAGVKRVEEQRSLNKQLGTDVKPKPIKITVNEKKALIDQIKTLNRGAKVITDGFKEISATINDILKEHKTTISTKQLNAIQKRMAYLKIGSNESIRKFVDYVEKVLENAEYADQLSEVKKINKRLKKALGNDRIPASVRATASDFIKIDPADVADLDKHQQYAEELYDAMKSGGVKIQDGIVVDKTRKSADLSKIDNYIAKELKLATERADESMIEEIGTPSPMDDKTPEIKAYVQDKFDKLKSMVRSMLKSGTELDGITNEFTADEKSLIGKVLRMDLNQLENVKDWYEVTEALDHLLTNGDLGLIPFIVNKYENAVAVNEGTKMLEDKFKGNISMLPITKFFEDVSATVSKMIDIHGTDEAKNKDSFNVKTMLEGRSYRGWDNLFKNWKDYGIYEKVFYQLAKAQANYKTLVTKMDAQRIAKRLFKANNYDQRKTLISKYKITAYLRQLEYESNPNFKNSHPAIDYLDAVVKASKAGNTPIQRKALEMLEEVISKNSTDGQISIEKLNKNLTTAEKEAISELQSLYKELLPYHSKVSIAIRNTPFKPIENYTHISSIGTPETGASALEIKKRDLLSTLGTKTGTIFERGTPTAISMDPFSTANSAIRDVMLDYWMTNPFRNVEKILNNFKKYSEQELDKYRKGDSGYKNAITRMNVASAFKDVYEDARENMLGRSYYESSPWKDIVQLMSKRAVQYTLGRPARLIAELGGNMSYIMGAVPDEFMLGVSKKYSDYRTPEMLSQIMINSNSSATERINPHGGFSSSVMDTQDFDISVADNQNAVGEAKRRALQAYYYTLGKGIGLGQKFNEVLITKGDLATAVPVWVGAKALEFKRITGKDIDFDKIKNKDAEYMDKYEDALEKSTTYADRKVTDVASSKNPFEVAPKMTHRSTQLFHAINKYMSGFRMTEYENASDAVMHLYKDGKMSREQALNTIEAITARAATYKTVQTIANTLIATGMIKLLYPLFNSDEDKTEMDKMLGADTAMTPEKKREVAKKWMEKFGMPSKETGTALMTTDKKAIEYEKRMAEEPSTIFDDALRGVAQQALALLTQRNFGNIINGVNAYIFEEYINKKARESMGMSYDPYKDNLLYNKIPDFTKKNWLAGTLEANLGSYGVPLGMATEMTVIAIDRAKLVKQLDEVDQLIADYITGVPVEDPSNKKFFSLIDKKRNLTKKIGDLQTKLLKELFTGIAMMSGAIPALKDIDKSVDLILQDPYKIPRDIERIKSNIKEMDEGASPSDIEDTKDKQPSDIYEIIKGGGKIPFSYNEAEGIFE